MTIIHPLVSLVLVSHWRPLVPVPSRSARHPRRVLASGCTQTGSCNHPHHPSLQHPSPWTSFASDVALCSQALRDEFQPAGKWRLQVMRITSKFPPKPLTFI